MHHIAKNVFLFCSPPTLPAVDFSDVSDPHTNMNTDEMNEWYKVLDRIL